MEHSTFKVFTDYLESLNKTPEWSEAMGNKHWVEEISIGGTKTFVVPKQGLVLITAQIAIGAKSKELLKQAEYFDTKVSDTKPMSSSEVLAFKHDLSANAMLDFLIHADINLLLGDVTPTSDVMSTVTFGNTVGCTRLFHSSASNVTLHLSYYKLLQPNTQCGVPDLVSKEDLDITRIPLF